MQLTEDITLKLIDEGSDIERPKSQLQVKGSLTQMVLDGAILEACIKCEGLYLLFVIDDIPYEEALYFYLLDGNFNMLDSASLGAPYSTGTFANLHLQPPFKAGFQFIGNTEWTIEILAQPRMRVPFLSNPKGVMHNYGFYRHFVVRGNPVF